MGFTFKRIMDKKEYKKWVAKLIPYWNEHRKLEAAFHLKEVWLEAKILKETGRDLTFYYPLTDGGCVGIGADKWDEREKFPLIHDADLEKGNK